MLLRNLLNISQAIGLCGMFALIVSIGFSCQKDKDAKNEPGTEDYPHSIGDYWKYSYLSPDSIETGILEVNIVGKQVFPDGDSAFIWVYKYPSSNDTVYKTVTDNTVKEYEYLPLSTDQMSNSMRYEFPLELGNEWAIPHGCADSVYVVEHKPVTVPANTFNDTFKLKMNDREHCLCYYSHSVYWVTPKIGIIKMFIDIFKQGQSMKNRNGTYELLEYHLK